MAEYRVIQSDGLEKSLLSHVRFIANVSIPAAKRFRKEYGEILRRIAENPYQFPTSQDEDLPDMGYREAGFASWYKAVFLVEGTTVYLDAVLDCRMDNQNIL